VDYEKEDLYLIEKGKHMEIQGLNEFKIMNTMDLLEIYESGVNE